jgi:hypothetical protein
MSCFSVVELHMVLIFSSSSNDKTTVFLAAKAVAFLSL